jgi:hypothetical protein|tara:strand:- start:508 stop:1185 length:678 start_codon:yes stop_codon:yes gene_type:complete
MKNVLSIVFLLLFVFVNAQTSGRIYNMKVMPGHAPSVLNLFTDFAEGHEWNEGSGVMLQSVQFKNGVTHRVLAWGDPENFGAKQEKTDSEWTAYLEQLNNHLSFANDSSVITSLGFSEGDASKNKSAKIFDLKVHEPAKFKLAFDKIVKQNKSILGDRRMGLLSIDAGGTPGATHSIVVYGKGLNDLVLLERKFRNSKGFGDYIKDRGKVEYIQNYYINTLARFN